MKWENLIKRVCRFLLVVVYFLGLARARLLGAGRRSATPPNSRAGDWPAVG